MLFSVEYQCGCKEDGVGILPRKCPMHGAPSASAFAASARALNLAYGKDVVWRAAFYPFIEGAKNWKAA